MIYRDKLAEKLQRHDMLRRRAIMDIPEFYVGMYYAEHCANWLINLNAFC